jgi:hypothetical protein
LFDDGGVAKRIPRRLLEGLIFGKDAMPEYANTIQRTATVMIENEQGKPLRIVESQGSSFTFDEHGKIDKGPQEAAAEAINSWPRPNIGLSKVVSLSPPLRRKRFLENHRWDLTKEHLDWIATDVWPSDCEEGSTPKASIASGIAPKRRR